MNKRHLAVLGVCVATATTLLATGFTPAHPAAHPAARNAAGDFPAGWVNYAGNQQHNAAYDVPASAPTALKRGVSCSSRRPWPCR